MPDLFIGNLIKDAREDEIVKIFESCGHVRKVRIVRKPEDPSVYGFIEIDADADAVIEWMNGYDLRGRRIRVAHSRR
jgi:RNA recognition motif-containing protein